MMTELAIYDMDRTITRTGTFTPFMIHAAHQLAPWRLVLVPLCLLMMLLYVVRLFDRKRLKEINQSLMLGRHYRMARLRPIAESFAERTLRYNVHKGALDNIEKDRAAGRRLVLATASSRLWVEPIAARLRFDDVIATNSIKGLDDVVSARVDGENCYGPAKLRMIEAWMAAEGLDRTQCDIRFYSDHASDAPVLAWADKPFAVNAHLQLKRLALARGWPILDWGF
jgi:HAD superfamily hydrolase (TIGR01490 family)